MGEQELYEKMDELFAIFKKYNDLSIPSQTASMQIEIKKLFNEIYEKGYFKGVEIKQELNN